MQTHTTGGRAHRSASLATPTNTAVVSDLTAQAPGRLLSVDEVAAVLGVPRAFVYALSRRGELPTVRIGERYVRYRAQTVSDWIAGQESTRRKGTQ